HRDLHLSIRRQRPMCIRDSAYTDPWGIKVTGVTIRDVSLPETMKRAIAKQAEAEREKRARIILAEGEFQAAERMKDAATLYQGVPTAIKLRELQTLAEIAREKNLIVVTESKSPDTGNIAALSKAISEKKEL
ncbi:SPFH domain-containing protein, partial [Methanosarcina mazei]